MGKILKIALTLSMFVGPVSAMATTCDEALAVSQDDMYLQAGDGSQTNWSLTVEFPAPLYWPQYVWIHFRASPPSTNFAVVFYNGDTIVSSPTELWCESGILGPFSWSTGPITRVMIFQRQQAGPGTVYIDAVTNGSYSAPDGIYAHYYGSTGPVVAFPSNAAPVAAPDADEAEAGLPVTITVLGNDNDADGDALSVTDAAGAAHGSVAVTDNGATVTYTSAPNYIGTDTFFYTISDGKGGVDMAEVTVAVGPRHVGIDIKPGSYPNSINLGSNGVVPIAILSTADFDATLVDPGTVSLAGASVAMRGKGNRYLASSEDVNGDGLLDLVLHIETENLNSESLQAGYGTVVGSTYSGMPIIGTDEITIVPQ